MPEIIKNKTVVSDDWTVLRLAEGETAETVNVPQGRVIVPLKVWQAQGEALKSRAEIGVWLASDERPEELKGQLDSFKIGRAHV